MDAARIADLLAPYIDAVAPTQLAQISTYIEVLLRWNAKMNLTSVREPERIVTRHFGESLFLARHISERGIVKSGAKVVDVGSGAGFPGIPLKIALPHINLTLVEAHQRKAVFLKEVLRAIKVDAEVKNSRAEDLVRTGSRSADLVTLRAVEKFEGILPVAAQFANTDGSVALLIGKQQVETARNLLKNWHFDPLCPIPGSQNRGILLGNQ